MTHVPSEKHKSALVDALVLSAWGKDYGDWWPSGAMVWLHSERVDPLSSYEAVEQALHRMGQSLCGTQCSVIEFESRVDMVPLREWLKGHLPKLARGPYGGFNSRAIGVVGKRERYRHIAASIENARRVVEQDPVFEGAFQWVQRVRCVVLTRPVKGVVQGPIDDASMQALTALANTRHNVQFDWRDFGVAVYEHVERDGQTPAAYHHQPTRVNPMLPVARRWALAATEDTRLDTILEQTGSPMDSRGRYWMARALNTIGWVKVRHAGSHYWRPRELPPDWKEWESTPSG